MAGPSKLKLLELFFCFHFNVAIPDRANYTRWDVYMLWRSHNVSLYTGGGRWRRNQAQPPPKLPETIHGSILWPSLPLTHPPLLLL